MAGERTNLARLTTDELVLLLSYRSCHIQEVRESAYEFVRLSAEQCRSQLATDNVVLFPVKVGPGSTLD